MIGHKWMERFGAPLGVILFLVAMIPAFSGPNATNAEPGWPPRVTAPQGAPNIVLILLDDVGFAAAGTFGGPVQTPELDQLAAQGLKYNRFHVTALCSPTRAALLSGRNAHQMGFGGLAEGSSASAGYDGIWKKSTASIADVLKRNGYSTAAIGKWHNTPPWEISPIGPFDRWPTGLGFEYFYGFMAGNSSQWEPSALYRNTTPVEASAKPEDGYHFTTDITNEAIRWVQTHQSLAPSKPYFLYFAPTAVHSPHHVPKEWINRYRGQFDQGWDKLREAIFVRQKKLGVIPATAELTPRPRELPAWDSLSTDQKEISAREMEVYAAFMAHTDHEVGHLLRAVQAGPEGDNTLILYIVGDNGADGWVGTEIAKNSSIGRRSAYLDHVLEQLDELGGVLSYPVISSSWAWAMSTPFQGFKTVASHLGGTRDPLIVSWPARIKDAGGLRSQFTHVNDVAPTIYEAAGISFPSTVDGVKQQPLEGTSFAYTFDQTEAPSRHRVQLFEQLGNRAIYQDGWVAAARHWFPWIPARSKEFEQDRWELYHVDEDFSQAHDLADRHPDKLKEMQAVFAEEARRDNVFPLRTNAIALEAMPSLSKGKHEFVYHAGFPRIGAWGGLHAPQFNESSHVITAEVQIPDKGAQGVLLSCGSRDDGGFALYVKDDRLVYESTFSKYGLFSPKDRDVITSTAPLPRGKVVLKFEFSKQPAAAHSMESPSLASGSGRLYVNGQPVSEARPVHITPAGYYATLGVGQAFGSPVSQAFDLPFKFTGTLETVKVELD